MRNEEYYYTEPVGVRSAADEALGRMEAADRLRSVKDPDRRGEDWARFLRCTLLPHALPADLDGARAELARLTAVAHPVRDGRLTECLDAYAVILDGGVDLSEGWQAWRLGLLPDLHAREVTGGLTTASSAGGAP
ncbi:hypothetical protein [Streptomyces sp. NPDC054961]